MPPSLAKNDWREQCGLTVCVRFKFASKERSRYSNVKQIFEPKGGEVHYIVQSTSELRSLIGEKLAGDGPSKRHMRPGRKASVYQAILNKCSRLIRAYPRHPREIPTELLRLSGEIKAASREKWLG